MENQWITIRPEAEKEIITFVQSGRLMEWNFWFEKVRAADESFSLVWAHARHLLGTESPDINLLNHVWRNNDYGSVGQGKISEKFLNEEKVLLAQISREMERALQAGIPVNKILDKVPDIKTPRGAMHAIRYRALAIISRLEIPSFYHEQYFAEFGSYLGEKLDLNFHGAALMHKLAEYLPENLRTDSAVRFTFPWILYEEIILSKKQNYRRWSPDETETDEQPESGIQQQKNETVQSTSEAEKQYWWMKIPHEIVEKLAGISLNKLKTGHQLGLPFEYAPAVRLGDKIFWPNMDGKLPQISFNVILTRDNDHLLMVDKVFNFPLSEDAMLAEPGWNYEGFLKASKNTEGFFKLNESLFNAVIRINTEIERKKRAEKSTVASRLHSDGETTEDKLNYRLYATAIAQIIKDERTKPPVNIAIVAPWGHGKTTLMEFLREKFEDRPKWKPKIATGVKMTVKAFYDGIKSMLGKVQTGEKVLETKRLEYPTVWFNPWKYQSSEQIWAGIGHALITQLIGKYEPEEQERIWLRLRLKRIDRNEIRKNIHRRILNSWIPWLAASVIAIVSGIIYSFLKPDNIIAQSTVATGFITAIVSGYLNWKKEQKSEVDGKLADYIREPDYTAKLGVFHEINEDLKIVAGELIDPSKPAIVFIDDLDRCTPKTVAEVFEAVNLMMTGELKDRCYFVIGMDAQMVAAALDTEYNSWSGRLPDQERRHGSVGWYFLDKFIQLPFFIPVMDPKKRKDFISELFRDAQPVKIENNVLPNAVEIQNAATEFVNVKGENVPSMFEVLRNNDPVQFQQVQELVVEKAIEQSKDSVEIDKAISNFSDFLDTSPRGMKRFANLLRFYDSQRIVRRMNAGSLQSEFPEFDVLGRWLVINLRWPQMVRWIQWEREEILLYTVDPEKKAEFIDKMIDEAIRDDETNRFENWKQRLDKLELEKKKHLLWLYDRDLFALLTSNASPDASLKKALECDVW